MIDQVVRDKAKKLEAAIVRVADAQPAAHGAALELRPLSWGEVTPLRNACRDVLDALAEYVVVCDVRKALEPQEAA